MVSTFCKLKEKAVINVCNGKQLGFVSDLEFDTQSGRILRLIMQNSSSFFSMFGNKNTLYIPWHCIERIGDDAILVRLTELPSKNN
ncbi:MAG: YlmC/YmxH family sporulation protein [Clostridia bacterium]|nr:YlmC/YmxH family sporulation protein [Clostridia bacterium]